MRAQANLRQEGGRRKILRQLTQEPENSRSSEFVGEAGFEDVRHPTLGVRSHATGYLLSFKKCCSTIA